jgi:hypothetical protein
MQLSRRPRALAGLAILVVTSACAAREEIGERDRAQIEQLLTEYRSAMIDAYRRGDPEVLAEVATERERARIGSALTTLEAAGTALRPELKRATTESIERSGRTAWTVTANEVWDLRTVTLGTEQAVGESLGQENRVLYTLIREDGRWWVLTRLLASSSAGS